MTCENEGGAELGMDGLADFFRLQRFIKQVVLMASIPMMMNTMTAIAVGGWKDRKGSCCVCGFPVVFEGPCPVNEAGWTDGGSLPTRMQLNGSHVRLFQV